MQIAKGQPFYVLRHANLEYNAIYETLEAAMQDLPDLIKKQEIPLEEVELMAITFNGDQISAAQVSWAKIAEALIKKGE
jgi:hypothetical protein